MTTSAQNKVIKYFIKNAPVGELSYLLEDISGVLGSQEFLHLDDIKQALREHYEAHCQHISLNENEKVLVS